MNHNTGKSEPSIVICYVWNMFSCWGKTSSMAWRLLVQYAGYTICSLQQFGGALHCEWTTSIVSWPIYEISVRFQRILYFLVYFWNLPYYQLSSKKMQQFDSFLYVGLLLMASLEIGRKKECWPLQDTIFSPSVREGNDLMPAWCWVWLPNPTSVYQLW